MFLGLEVLVGRSQGLWSRTIEYEWIRQAEEQKIIQCWNAAEKHQASDPIGILME